MLDGCVRMEQAVKNFLENHSFAFNLNENKTRVVCSITGHELPLSIAALESYVNSKKYKQLTKDGTCNLSNIAEFKKYLIPSKKGRNKLFCLVTRKEINNIPSHIENHVTGRKFQRDLKLYKEKMQNRSRQEDQNKEDVVVAQKEVKIGLMDQSDDESNEENMDEGEEHEDSEFLGGIWVPEGMEDIEKQTAPEDVSMDIEVEENEGKKTTAFSEKENNRLKRKLKETKKGKAFKTMSQKKKR